MPCSPFDCRGYDIPSADKNVEQTSREGLVKYILDKQLKDGGWAYSGDKTEPDMTAMALQVSPRIIRPTQRSRKQPIKP